MPDVADRYGAEIIKVGVLWSQPIDSVDVKKVLNEDSDAALVGISRVETGTGVLQPMDKIGANCQGHDALFLMARVTLLGGVPVEVDERGVEISFSGAQKCYSCPTGLAPLSMSERALGKFGCAKRG